MNIIKVVNGKVILCTLTGSHIRTIVHNNAIDADMNSSQTKILVTTSDGKVKLYTNGGSLIRTLIHDNAINSKFNGSDILIKTNTKYVLVNESGSLIRSYN